MTKRKYFLTLDFVGKGNHTLFVAGERQDLWNKGSYV